MHTYILFSYSIEADTEKRGGKTKLILSCNYPFTRFYFTCRIQPKLGYFIFFLILPFLPV